MLEGTEGLIEPVFFSFPFSSPRVHVVACMLPLHLRRYIEEKKDFKGLGKKSSIVY